MKISINGTEKGFELLPSKTEVLDATLDTLSFSILSTDQEPYSPLQEVTIEENGTTDYFIIVADSVEPFTLKNTHYRHNLTCTEKARILSKHLVRNSVFTQPANIDKIARTDICYVADIREGNGRYNYTLSKYSSYEEGTGKPLPVYVKERDKVARAFVEIRLQIATGDGALRENDDIYYCERPHNLSEVETDGQLSYIGYPKITYSDGVNLVEKALTEADFGSFEFNREFEIPSIIDFINQVEEEGVKKKEGYYSILFPPNYIYANQVYGGLATHAPFCQVEARLRLETYYYTAYDILELLLKRQRQTREIDGSVYENAPLFELPTEGRTYELLKSTIAPDFYFTQSSMYECVAEVFRLFDGIFKMNGNVLELDPFNERKDEVEPIFTGHNQAIAEERRANGFVVYYQDARVYHDFPSKEGFGNVRTKTIGVPGKDDYVFKTDFDIDFIRHCDTTASIQIGVFGTDYDQKILVYDYWFDITRYVVKKDVWSNNLSETSDRQTADPGNVVQNNSVYYDGNQIELSYSYNASWGTEYYAFGNLLCCALWQSLGLINVEYLNAPLPYSPYANLFGPVPAMPDWDMVELRVNYATSCDGRLRIENGENQNAGDMLLDQSSGGVDLGKLGLNVLGLSLKMGQPTLSANIAPRPWANRIKRGDYIQYENKTWIANSISYTLLGNGLYRASVSFVKDYNELSLRKSVIREKRLTEISRNLAIKSEDNITEYCYFSSTRPDVIHEATALNKYFLFNQILSTFGRVTNIPFSHVCILKESKGIFVPSIRYGAGNCLNLEMSYDDPINAGIQTTWDYTGWFGTSVISKYILYPDDDGFMEECYLLGYKGEAAFAHNFPEVNRDETPIFSMVYHVYKQPNETFALNYSVTFLAEEPNRDFIGKEFIEHNAFVNGNSHDIHLYLSDEKYTILDQKAKGTEISFSAHTQEAVDLQLMLTHEERDCKAWCIADSNKNILFASNNPQTKTSKSVYFSFTPFRLE